MTAPYIWYDDPMSRWTIAAALLLLALPAAAQQRTRLQVYSTLEVENIADFKKAFEAENKDVEIAWIRDSTGVLTAKIMAEQGNQRADAIWGLAVTSTMQLKARGLLEPYAPKNLAALKPSFRDPADPPSYVGMEAWVAAVCFNTVEAQKLALPKPSSWFDLLDPSFKGKITMEIIVAEEFCILFITNARVYEDKSVSVFYEQATQRPGT